MKNTYDVVNLLVNKFDLDPADANNLAAEWGHATAHDWSRAWVVLNNSTSPVRP